MLLLADVAQYTLNTWDEDAIHMGLSATNTWQERYYDYVFVGKHTLQLSLALDEKDSTDLVFIRIEYAAQLNALIDLLVYAAQTLL